MQLRFEPECVREVPEQPGIFCLWHHSHLVYIGRTAPKSNLRREIDHALTMAMVEDLAVTHFTYEVTNQPKTRATEELRDYFERWGSLPRYNDSRHGLDVRQPVHAGAHDRR